MARRGLHDQAPGGGDLKLAILVYSHVVSLIKTKRYPKHLLITTGRKGTGLWEQSSNEGKVYGWQKNHTHPSF